ncbi:hypothetical protein LCI18_005880 [Fusarium solani-melongenae]|uniref:Uncharacterized protein n=1 Tax=Fusarium solani subsp. cucurbitae TaxID=2747967 RepID=A0ACD3Z1G0_FUSSC|nr:hypothetical protein LCI18_005880 [Fusarium solani-melongenae]
MFSVRHHPVNLLCSARKLNCLITKHECNEGPIKMDPFSKLPPELRLHILLLLRCKRSMLRFAQASPVILQQYLTSKPYIKRKLITLDFDDEMIQDAMGIILLPSSDALGDYSTILHQHHCTWSAQHLPNPLTAGDDSLVDQLHELQTRLLLFIEDYLTKATARFPPREYLCLPDLSPNHTRLMFKDQEFSARFDATELTDDERKRLLRAFLRAAIRGFQTHQWVPFLLKLPDCYTRMLSTSTRKPTPQIWACKTQEISFSTSMAAFGFDLVTSLVRSATAGRHGRDRLERWLRDLFGNGEQAFPTRIAPDHYLYLGRENQERNNLHCNEAPGMYQLLHTQLSGHSSLHANIYRQRAWTFFDDDRFYPSSGGVGPHFPTLDELGEPLSETGEYEEWFSNPKRARALHRSQKWHDERVGKAYGVRRPHEPQNAKMEMAPQAPLPVTTEAN